MKLTSMILFVFIGSIADGQSKFELVSFDRLTEVVGTEYVIASTADHSKIAGANNDHLLFINTRTNEITEVDFPADAHIGELEQVKIDSLGINWVLLSARTVDVQGKNGIDWMIRNRSLSFRLMENNGSNLQLMDFSLRPGS